jgi:hypothetical protein
MALEQEIKTYEQKLPELLAYEGKFVLIHGAQIIGEFDSYAEALRRGYDQFESQSFLVKQIKAVEPVQFVARV